MNNQSHPFHLVDPSPWPIVTATAAFGTTTGGVMYFHNYIGGNFFNEFKFKFFSFYGTGKFACLICLRVWFYLCSMFFLFWAFSIKARLLAPENN